MFGCITVRENRNRLLPHTHNRTPAGLEFVAFAVFCFCFGFCYCFFDQFVVFVYSSIISPARDIVVATSLVAEVSAQCATERSSDDIAKHLSRRVAAV